MPPQLPKDCLPTDIPDGEIYILVLDCLYVETYTECEPGFVLCRCGLTDRRHGVDYLSQSQFIETTNKLEGFEKSESCLHSCFSSRIEP